MSRLKYVLFSVLLIMGACSKAPKDEGKTAEQQQPAAQQPEAQQPPAAEAPATQAQPAPEATTPRASAPKPKTAAAAKQPSSRHSGSSTADNSRPISRSEAASENPRAEAPAGSAVVPPTRSDVPAPNVASEPPKPRLAVLPSGTKLNVRLTEALSSDDNRSGDKFEATLDHDLQADGRVIAPRGSVVVGKVVKSDQGGRVQGLASMSLTLTELRTRTASYPIQTNTLSFDAQKSTKSDATKIGAGAGIGAVIGAIAGGGKGAAIGAAVGGAAGTGTVLATRGKAVKFPAEHQLEFSLRDDLQVRLQ